MSEAVPKGTIEKTKGKDRSLGIGVFTLWNRAETQGTNKKKTMTNIETYTQVTLQNGYTGNREVRAILHLQATMPIPDEVDLLDAVPPAIRSRAVAQITEMLIGDDLRRLAEIHYRLSLIPGTGDICEELSEMLKAYWPAPSPGNSSPIPTA